MRTRDIEPGDLDEVNEVTVACNLDYATWAPADWAPPDDGWENERAGWADLLGNAATWGAVAIDDDGRCAGVVAVDAEDEVRRLFVRPASQGRGIGRRLLDLAEGEVRRRGRAEALLWTPEGSRAVGFYRSLDWRPDGRSRFHERLRLQLIAMSKRL